jgi:hypothetical protein
VNVSKNIHGVGSFFFEQGPSNFFRRKKKKPPSMKKSLCVELDVEVLVFFV